MFHFLGKSKTFFGEKWLPHCSSFFSKWTLDNKRENILKSNLTTDEGPNFHDSLISWITRTDNLKALNWEKGIFYTWLLTDEPNIKGTRPVTKVS